MPVYANVGAALFACPAPFTPSPDNGAPLPSLGYSPFLPSNQVLGASFHST